MKKLLDGVTVEWKALGDVAELIRGNGLQKKDFTKTGVPAIHYGQIYTYYGLSTTETISFVSPELAKSLKKVETGDIVITNTSENLEDVSKAVVYLGKVQAVTGGHATIIKPSRILLNKFFAYYTQTEEFSTQKRKYAKGTKVIDVSAVDLSKILIPIPCPDQPKKSLEIQSEIVRILDKFTELSAELSARKMQYNFYRDKLLTFAEGEAEWKALGEVCEIKTGKGITKHDSSISAPYPIISGGKEPMGYYDRFNRIEETVTISRVGANAGYVSFMEKKFYLNDKCFSVLPTGEHQPKINNKFLFYFLKSKEESIIKLQSEGGVPTINTKKVGGIQIPIPSLEEQNRIVAILDKFDALTHSITEGLPREIELRQKQYEYYRNLLLSFPKKP